MNYSDFFHVLTTVSPARINTRRCHIPGFNHAPSPFSIGILESTLTPRLSTHYPPPERATPVGPAAKVSLSKTPTAPHPFRNLPPKYGTCSTVHCSAPVAQSQGRVTVVQPYVCTTEVGWPTWLPLGGAARRGS